MNSYVLDKISAFNDIMWKSHLNLCDPQKPLYLIQYLLMSDTRTYAFIRRYHKEILMFSLKRYTLNSLCNMRITYDQLKQCWNDLTEDFVTIIPIILHNDLINYIKTNYPEDHKRDDLLPYVYGEIHAFKGIYTTSIPKILRIISLSYDFFNDESFKSILKMILESASTSKIEALLRSEIAHDARRKEYSERFNIDYFEWLLTTALSLDITINVNHIVTETNKSEWPPYQKIINRHILLYGHANLLTNDK